MKKILIWLLCLALACVPAFAEDILDARVEALRSLGLEISDAAVDHVRQSVDEIWKYLPEDSFTYQDGKEKFYEYPNLLYTVGRGILNAETFAFEPLTDDFYAFDTEMLDMPRDYFALMEAVERMSGGELEFGDYGYQADEEDWIAGEGEMLILFSLNGTAHEFKAEMMYDWMDCRIIDFLNGILAESGLDRIWCMFDGMQGFVLFYNDGRWAQEFQRVTDYSLYLSPDAAMAFMDFEREVFAERE